MQLQLTQRKTHELENKSFKYFSLKEPDPNK